NQVPFREDGPLVLGATTKGRWSYACSKALDEFLALAYWREKKLPTPIVRPFYTPGPPPTGRDGTGISPILTPTPARPPPPVYGDGQQSRCFAYVGDVVGALIQLMDHPAAVGQVFNIGSTEEITITELARRVKRLANSPSEIVFVPYDQAYEPGFEDMPRRIPDVSKVRNLVGFRPTRDLDAIIQRVIDYYLKQPSFTSSRPLIAAA